MMTVIRQDGSRVDDGAAAALLPALAADSKQLFWLDLEAPTAAEFQVLSDVFHFHPLAVEDATHPHQRPKVDEFEGYFFVTADEVTLCLDGIGATRNAAAPEPGTAAAPGEGEDVQARQVSAFLGANYLVTIHVVPVEAVRALRDRCGRNQHVLEQGPDYLLYVLLDILVDGYFPLLECLDDQMDLLEDRIVSQPDRSILETIFRLKRDLSRLRRFAGPLREVVQTLTTRNFPNIQDRSLPYFRDVADHLFRIYETLDSYRDLMSNMLDAYLSQVNNEMSRVMQKLSSVATVFLPITFITGVFGMNFSNQPWLNTNFWFWATVMTAIAAFTYWWFHRHRWV